jgi:hypothetical protein
MVGINNYRLLRQQYYKFNINRVLYEMKFPKSEGGTNDDKLGNHPHHKIIQYWGFYFVPITLAFWPHEA